MRALWIKVLLSLALLLTIGIWTALESSNATKTYAQYAERLEKMVNSGEWAQARALLDEVGEDFEGRGDRLQTWVNHADVDVVALSIRQLRRTLEEEERIYTLMTLEEFKEGVSHLYHRDAFALKNIL